MNEQMQDFARQNIKEGLAQLPKFNQHLFKRMYLHKNIEADINDIIDAIPENKLDWAMQQVQNTLDKRKTL